MHRWRTLTAAVGTQEAVDVAFAAVSVGRKLILAGIPDDDKTSFSASVARCEALWAKENA